MANTIGTAYINIAPNMQGIQGKIAGGLRGSGQAFAQQFGTEISGKSAFIIGAIAGVAQSAVTKATSLIAGSIGNAIKRVDTLASAQRTFQYMGFAAKDAATATKAVTTSILGLPTPLDSAIRGMTALAATYGNVKLGQRVFSALNDAILGFGGSAAEVDNAIQQLSQLPLDGPLDAQTWNSLRNSGITPVLVAMSKDMHRSVGQLKDDLGSGKLTVKDFTNELTKLDTKGGGGLVSLQKIAQNSTSGIGTGFANMQTAITRGLASIIQAIGQKNISNAISNIGKVFESALKSIAVVIPKVVNGIKTFFDYVNRNKTIFYPIAVAIGAIATAIIAWKTALGIWSGITKIATAIQAAFNAVMDANPITLIALAIIGLVAGLTYFFAKTQLGKQIWADFVGFLTGVWNALKIGFAAVATFFQNIWNAIRGAISSFINWFTANWRIIIAIVLGPLGLLIDFVTAYWAQITGAITTAVGAIFGVVRAVFGAIVGFLRVVFSPIIKLYIAIWSTIFNIVAGAVSRVWSVVSGTFGKVLSFLGGVGGKIIGVFAGAGSWLFDVGKDIINGLLHGAGSILPKIGTFFLDKIPNWIKGPFKKALGISSPSKVFAVYGKNITEGLVGGISKSALGVTRAVSNMADNAMAGMSGANMSANFSANASSTYGASNGATQLAGGPAIVQNNNIYNQVDLNTVTRELAWQVKR